MKVQVMTDGPTRRIQCGRVIVDFVNVPVTETMTQTDCMNLSAPETTAFDLVHYYQHAGYLNNVAEVLYELTGKIDPEHIDFPAGQYNLPDSQRLCYIMEIQGSKDLARNIEPMPAVDQRYDPHVAFHLVMEELVSGRNSA